MRRKFGIRNSEFGLLWCVKHTGIGRSELVNFTDPTFTVPRVPNSEFRIPNCIRLCLLLCLWVAAAATAQARDTEITRLRVGFEGFYKLGYWTPVEITVQGGDEPLVGDVSLTVPDGDGVASRVSSATGRGFKTTAGQTGSVLLYAKIGRADGDVTATLRVGRKVVATKTFSMWDKELGSNLAPGQPLIVACGGNVPLDSPRAEGGGTSEKKPVVVRLAGVNQLATQWYGYEGVDAVVLLTSQAEIYRRLSASDARRKALDEWVRRGGKLVLCVGKEANEILAPGAPLADFAPGRWTGNVPLRQTAALETFVDPTERLDTGTEVAEFRLDVPKLADVRGKIEVFEGAQPTDLPLVVRTPRGFGQVVFMALDPDRPPLSGWKALPQFWEKVLALKRPLAAESESGNVGQVTTLGYSDLAGQLHSALDRFEGVQLAPFWLVTLLILLYILCIGPLDYFLVKRVLKRMELTWVTFPAIVVIFSVGAYLLAYELKGDQLRVNQAEVIDVDLESGLVRGTLWANLFSPRIDSYNLTLAPKPPSGTVPSGTVADNGAAPPSGKSPPSGTDKSQVLLSWMGLPGDGFGGMSPQRGGTPTLFGGSYSFSPQLDALVEMPVAVWSTKAVTARWSCDSEPHVTAEVRDSGDRDELLSGTIASHLSFPLSDCAVIYSRWAYPLGKLEQSQNVTIDNRSERQTIDTYFKHSFVAQDIAPVAIYDRSSQNSLDILPKMMFHELYGGEKYTRLSNDYQHFIDLSDHVKIGRAILVGRATATAAQLVRDGKPMGGNPSDERLVYYRFVIPVQQGKPAGD